MALPFSSLSFLSILLFLLLLRRRSAAAMWCVARSDASNEALQTALDYACFAGADCAPIQSSGLCFLPNTVQAHASYAFNSYFQRKAMAPGACYFAGIATLAETDPSYGSCVYPSSLRTAGGTPTATTSFGGTPGTITGNNPTTTPTTTTTPLYNGGGNGLTPPGTRAPEGSGASSSICAHTSLAIALLAVALSLTF